MPKISALPPGTQLGSTDAFPFLSRATNVTERVSFDTLQSAVANAGVVQNLIARAVSVGIALPNLASNTLYAPVGVGALSSTTVQKKIAVIVDAVADFGMVAGANGSGAANKVALQKAIDSLGLHGGKVTIPAGFFFVDPGVVVGTAVNKSITIEGSADGYAYQPLDRTLPSYQGGTVIVWANAGAIGFDLSQIDNNAPAGNYTHLANMVVAGTAANPVNTGIKGSGVFTLSNMAVEGHTDHGLWMYEFCNTVLLNHVSFCGNTGGTGYGLRVGPGGVSFRDNTLFRASDCAFRQNTVGVRIEQAANFKFDHFVIESNSSVGLSIFRYTALPSGTVPSIDGGGNVGAVHGQTRDGHFDTGNFENNGYGDVTGATPQVLIDAQVPSFDKIDTPDNMTFENIVMAGYLTTALGVWQPNFKINCGQEIKVLRSFLGTKDPSADGSSLSPTLLGAFSSDCTFNNVDGNTVFTDTGSDNCTVNDLQTSFPITLTGMATNVTGTAFFNVVHKQMTIDIPALAGTSNSISHTIQFPGLSANLFPAHTKYLSVPMFDSGAWNMGFCEFNGPVPNELKLWKNSMNSNFATAGVFIFKGGQLPYSIR